MGNQFKLKGVFPLLFSVTRVQNPALKNFLTKETILLLGSGPDKISNLSSFQPPFTHYPVINLTQYPLQLDLLLYCSVIISINFKGHGFMHQENHICTTSGEWHFFFQDYPNPPYFKIEEHLERLFTTNYDIITVQIRFNDNLQKLLGIHKCFLDFQIWRKLSPRSPNFLRLFRFHIMYFLDNIGAISINNVIQAVSSFAIRMHRHILSDIK